MDKKYSVFVSSTYTDLMAERKQEDQGTLIRCLLAPLMWRNPVQSYS